MQVTITALTEPDELHCHYQGEFNVQPCVLALNLEHGTMTCHYNAAIGSGIPASVYNRRTLWYDIPVLTADAANTLMESLKPLAQRILDGATIEWDGNGNHRGELNADAQAADTELAENCAPELFGPEVEVAEYDAGDWFGGEGPTEARERLGLTADTTDKEIEALAATEAAEASAMNSNDGHTILCGASEWLTSEREDLRDAVREELDELIKTIADMINQRNAAICRLAEWGDSNRSIATRVGRSHPWVANIVEVYTRHS